MRRTHNQLTTVKVERVREPGCYIDGGNLYLQVGETGTKSWLFAYTLNGRYREMGLGSVSDFSLREARERARECRQLLAAKIDPIDARNAQRTERALEQARSLPFSDCAEKYIASHRAGWKNGKHGDQWANTLATYCTPFNSVPVAEIDTTLVLKALEPIWESKHETATRVRARVEAVLDWARVSDLRKGENPARWKGHLNKLLPKISKKRRVKHHPALPYVKLGEFMETLRAQDGTAARALEFTILTAARTGEVIGARRDEFDLKRGLWTIPASRMKSVREHRVPLSPRAVEIVRAQPEGEHVFPGLKDGAPLSNMSMLQLLRRMGRDDVTVHGFRSSFRDWAAETTNYPREVAEMALAHVVGDATEAAYLRTDLFEKRRGLMADWSAFCSRPAPRDKVTPIRRKG